MNTVLNSKEVTITDTRLARCKHPRLRQALMFHPPQSGSQVAKPRLRVTETVSAGKPAGGKTMKTVTSFAATTFVRVMSFLFDGFQFVTTPV
jgi:hypothetical protein